MKKKLFFSALSLCFILGVNAQAPTADPNQPQLIERVTAQPGELKIPYEKWKLPNGLVVIVNEDHSDPIVHVEITYHVGSARETPGKSGFAHFFEHMMFQGSEHVKDEEHFKIVEGAGGQMNGNTDRDRTTYFETVPKNYLEMALWLEADRMGFLLDSVTQKKFEVQRATVKNEKDQDENRPYGKTDEIKDQFLYPDKHPYSWSTIGYVEDLNRVDVEDLKNFFMRWYGPNNASLVVSGDITAEQVLKLAMKYFAPIPRGPEVRKMRLDAVRLPQNVYANYGDKIYLPLMDVVYPGVPNYHPDEAPLDLLAAVLGDGNNSIFYKNFVKSEKAAFVRVANPSSELAGEFTIQVYSFPDGETDVEKLINQTLDEFDKTGVDDDALARAKAQMESQFIQSMQTLAGKSGQLMMWNYLQPNKAYNVNDEIARYGKVTKEDVMRVFRQYVKGKYACIVNVFPKNTNAAAAKDEVKIASTSGEAKKGELEYKGLSYKKPVDNFDRTRKPEIGPSVTPVVPKFYSAKFDNGLNVIGTTSSESPFVTLLLNIRGGSFALGNDVSKAGLANFTARMMEEATQKYTSEQFSNELEKLGASVSFNTSREFTTVVVNTPKKNVDKVLALFEEKLLHPKFTAEDFQRNQRQIAEGINSQRVSASAMANKAFGRLVYGKSIASEPVEGSIKTIKAMNVKDIQSFYDKYYSPSVSNLVIVGDITEGEIMPKLTFLKNWAKKDIQLPEIANSAPAIEKTQIYLVDKYKAQQSEVRVGYLALPYDYNGKYFKASVMNFPLGGQFNSRLNLDLREDKGYTYGIYSRFAGTKNVGPFVVSAGVKDSTTDLSIKEIMSVMGKYHEGGITDEELAFTKKSMSQSDALRYEGTYQKAGFLGQIVNYNLPADYIEQQNKLLQTVTKDEVNSLTKELLPMDKMVIVIVGDKDLIQKPLEKLGYKVNEYKLD
jgi:zinc protease